MQARLLLCLLVVGVIGAGWFGSEHVLRHNDSPDVDLTPAVAAAHPPSSSATLTSAPTSTRAAPAVQTYLQRQEFQRRLQSYIAQAASMAPDARASQAIEIEHGVDRYETAGELSAGEAMLLRAALIPRPRRGRNRTDPATRGIGDTLSPGIRTQSCGMGRPAGSTIPGIQNARTPHRGRSHGDGQRPRRTDPRRIPAPAPAAGTRGCLRRRRRALTAHREAMSGDRRARQDLRAVLHRAKRQKPPRRYCILLAATPAISRNSMTPLISGQWHTS